MKTIPLIKINEADVSSPASPLKDSKASKNVPLDAHEVLDFYKSHSEEIKAIMRTMGTTNRAKQMFMLGYYIGNAKR